MKKSMRAALQAHGLLMEKEFLSKVYCWGEGIETTDAIYHYLSCFSRFNKEEKEGDKIFQKLNEDFSKIFFHDYLDGAKLGNNGNEQDEGEDCFGIRLSKYAPPTIYSTFCAFAGIAALTGFGDENEGNQESKKDGIKYPIDYQQHGNALQKLGILNKEGWDKIRTNVREFLVRSFSETEGAFRESHWDSNAPTSVINSSALRLIAILGLADDAIIKEYIPSVIRFFDRCMRDEKDEYPYQGFSSEPGGEIIMCPSFFVGKTLFSKHYWSLTKHDVFKEGFDGLRNKMKSGEEKVKALLRECWYKDGKKGGFRISPAPGEVPTVVHTKHAMKLYEIAIMQGIDGKDVEHRDGCKDWLGELSQLVECSGVEEFYDKVMNLLKECSSQPHTHEKVEYMEYGYGFAKGFVPNIFATRNVIDILDIFKKHELIDDQEISGKHKAIASYLRSAFYNEKTNEITAFPREELIQMDA